MVKSGADLNKRDHIGRSCLHYLVQPSRMSTQDAKNVVEEEKRGEVTKWLLEHEQLVNKLDINAATHGGVTPLMLAAKTNNQGSVEALLNARANPFIKDQLGREAKDYTVCQRQFNQTG